MPKACRTDSAQGQHDSEASAPDAGRRKFDIRLEGCLHIGYNHAMFSRRRREAPLVAVLSAVLVLSILLPFASFAEATSWHPKVLQLQSPCERLESGKPFDIDCDIVLYPLRMLPDKLQNTHRPQQAAVPPQLDVLPSPSFESPSARHLPRFLSWKNRRHICQLIDLPPPSLPPLRAL